MDWSNPLANGSWQQKAAFDRDAVIDFVLGFSVTAKFPVAGEDPTDWNLLPPQTRVHVAPSARSSARTMIAAAQTIRRAGFEPVPVIAAQWFDNTARLDELLDRLRGQSDVRELVVLGVSEPDTMRARATVLDALEIGLFDRHGITRINVPAFSKPDGAIPLGALEACVGRYNALALCSDTAIHFVTPPGADCAKILSWERAARQAGNRLPVHASLLGPSAPAQLSSLERLCGILPPGGGDAVTYLQVALTEPNAALKMLAGHRWHEPDSALQAPHFVTSGPLSDTARWIDAVLRSAFVLRE